MLRASIYQVCTPLSNSPKKQNKQTKKTGTGRVCAAKGLFRLLCSILFFQFKCLLGFCILFRSAYSNKSEIMEEEIFAV